MLSSSHFGNINQVISSAINVSVDVLEVASVSNAIHDFSTEKSHKEKLFIALHSWEGHCWSWILKAVTRIKWPIRKKKRKVWVGKRIWYKKNIVSE